MSFLYPYFLFALFLLAVPVIIHFFNFKKHKTVFFSNVKLLKLIKQDSKKKSQLKHILILLARLAALSSLVFAFSRPYIPQNIQGTKRAHQIEVIYIDNSFSMKAEGENGPLLEQAKKYAITLANSFRNSSEFILLTNDNASVQQIPFSKNQFIQQVSEIRESNHSTKLSEIYAIASGLRNPDFRNADKNLILISDFQKYTSDFESIKPDSSVYVSLLPLSSHTSNNLMVDSCWFEIPGRKIGQNEKLFVHISNQSTQAYQNIPIRLTINDSLKAVATISVNSSEKKTIELNFTNNSSGIQLGKVELDDYPVIYDNTFFFSYIVRDKIDAIGIFNPLDNGSEYLKNLFLDDELISYTDYPQENVQISQIKSSSCVYLLNNQNFSSGLISELSTFTANGGTLVLFPPKETDYAGYNALLSNLNQKTISGFDTTKTGISEINYDHELFAGVFRKKEDEADLPVINGYIVFNEQVKQLNSSVLKFRNGKNALSSGTFGNGTVYTFAFPLNSSNLKFVKHILFVPTLYNMVLQSGEHQKYSYPVDSEEPVYINKTRQTNTFQIVNKQTGEEFITPIRTFNTGKQQIVLDEIPKTAGHFLVKDGTKIIQSISYNFSRNESANDFLNEKDLLGLIQSKKFRQFHLLKQADSGNNVSFEDPVNSREYWKLFIALALIFMIVEMGIIRFWK